MALCAEPPSRASLHFFSTIETAFVCRGAWEKAPSAHARNGLMGRTRPHEDPQLSPSVEKLAVGASCMRALCTKAQKVPEHCQREPVRHAHLLCCWFGRTHFESHNTLIDGLRLHPEANGYAKRLLADLQTLAFVPEWAEAGCKPLNWNLVTSSVWGAN